MATKTWTENPDFAETHGDFDGVKWQNDELLLHLRKPWQSKTWLGETDEVEEWIGDETEYVQRGYWRTNFDSGIVSCGWGNLSWNATEPASSNVKLRARSASDEGGLAGATYTSYYESSPVDNEAVDNRWLQLEVVLVEGSTPTVQDVSQNYGPGC